MRRLHLFWLFTGFAFQAAACNGAGKVLSFPQSPCPQTYPLPVAYVGASVRSQFQDAAGNYDVAKLTHALCTSDPRLVSENQKILREFDGLGGNVQTSIDLSASAQSISQGQLNIEFDWVALSPGTPPPGIVGWAPLGTYLSSAPAPLNPSSSTAGSIAFPVAAADFGAPPTANSACEGRTIDGSPPDSTACQVYGAGQGQRVTASAPLSQGSGPNLQYLASLDWAIESDSVQKLPLVDDGDQAFQPDENYPNFWASAAVVGTYSASSVSVTHVISETPIPGATGVARGAQVLAVFSVPLAKDSLTESSFAVSGPDGAPVPGSLSLAQTSSPGDTVVFAPTQAYAALTVYTVSISSALTDAGGSKVAENSWTFTAGPVACDGTAAVGHACSTGGVFAGTLGGLNYMTTPSGCGDGTCSTAATGAVDSFAGEWGFGASMYDFGTGNWQAGCTIPGTTSGDGALFQPESTAADAGGNATIYQQASIACNGAGKLLLPFSGQVWASDFCFNLNYGGFRDWYLPAQSELELLYGNQGQIGGFAPGKYWSSTISNSTTSQTVAAFDFTSGTVAQIPSGSSTQSLVRCVRRYYPGAP